MLRAGGRVLPWTRDPVEMYAFRCDVPAGATSVDVALDCLAPMRLGLRLTLLLGSVFIVVQGYEWVTNGFGLDAGTFGSTFYVLTGFHGAHVTAGVLWLVTLLAIDYRRGLGSRDSLLVDIAALYWHFVDVIWIVIFTLVYLIK